MIEVQKLNHVACQSMVPEHKGRGAVNAGHTVNGHHQTGHHLTPAFVRSSLGALNRGGPTKREGVVSIYRHANTSGLPNLVQDRFKKVVQRDALK